MNISSLVLRSISALAAVLALSSCGSQEPTTDSTATDVAPTEETVVLGDTSTVSTTTSSTSTVPEASPEDESPLGDVEMLQAWLPELHATLNEYARLQNEATEQYRQTIETPQDDGWEVVDAEIRAADFLAQELARLQFPDLPAGAALSAEYVAFRTQAAQYVSNLQFGVARLIDALPRIDEEWRASGNSETFTTLVDALYEVDYLDACVSLAEEVLAATDVALDCIGTDGTLDSGLDTPVDLAVGPVRVNILGSSSELTFDQESSSTIEILSKNDEFLSLTISWQPRFAEPGVGVSGASNPLAPPDDLTAWLESLSTIVLAEGASTIGGAPAVYRDFTITEENEAKTAVTSDVPVYAEITDEFGGHSLQMVHVAVNRIYRVETDAGPVFLFISGRNAEVAYAPPFLPASDDAFSWAEVDVLPLLSFD